MENNELLDLLEQEYLQEYRKIQNRLLKKIRKSSYLNVELHDIANQLYTAQLRRLKPQDIYNGDEAAFINGIVRSVPEPLLLKNKKSKAGNRAVIIVLVAVIIMISFYALSRSVAIDDQRKAMGYLQESSNYRTIQQEIKEEAVYTFQLKDVSFNEGKKVYEEIRSIFRMWRKKPMPISSILKQAGNSAHREEASFLLFPMTLRKSIRLTSSRVV